MSMRTRDILPDASDAAALAATAEKTAADAHQMIVARDTIIEILVDAAAQLPITRQAAAVEHQSLQDQIDALVRRTATVQTKRTQLGAQVLLNGTGTVAFTWDTAFPDTAYTAVLIAPLPITDVTPTLTKTGVTFSYKAGAIIAVGTTMQALAIRYG